MGLKLRKTIYYLERFFYTKFLEETSQVLCETHSYWI